MRYFMHRGVWMSIVFKFLNNWIIILPLIVIVFFEDFWKVDDIFKSESVFTLRQFANELRPRPNKELSVVVWDFMKNQALP